MSHFTGWRALELLNERGLEIPFIFVSGTIGEETAVRAMKHGAADYLFKDRLARLGQAVVSVGSESPAGGAPPGGGSVAGEPVLPDRMGAEELAALLRKEKPALKVLLTSGYANKGSGEAFRPPPGAPFIPQPHKARALAQGVRDAPDGRFNH